MGIKSARRTAAVLVAAVFMMAACGDSGDKDAGSTGSTVSAGTGTTVAPTTTVNAAASGSFNLPATTPTPVKGGTLTVGIYSETAGLDPAVSFGSGAAGAGELGAIYDVLMRYDPATGQFVPKLASALTANADSTVWTLKLRPNVKFTDGTPYNAAAVVFNLKRHVTKKSISAGRVGLITTYDTPDDLTVVMTLSQPWAGFPYLLADLPGMIGSPTAIGSMGDQAFNLKPVGAGAFKVSQYAPADKLVLTANADYWGGAPYLDGVTFLRVGDGATSLDALKNGTVKEIMMREFPPLADARKSGLPGFVNMRPSGISLAINVGIGGKKLPTSDVRVRKAIAMAFDPKAVNERAYAGTGFPGTQLFQSSSRWYDNVAGIAYNPTEAKKLLDAVKAETGWDGSLHFVSNNTPVAMQTALTIQTQLEQVGFKINLDNAFGAGPQTTKLLVANDFDISTWGCNIDDAGLWVWLNQCINTKSSQAFGFSDATMDTLLDQLRSTSDIAAQKKIVTSIANRFNETVPFVPISQVAESRIWAKNVYGLVSTMSTVSLYDKAFISG